MHSMSHPDLFTYEINSFRDVYEKLTPDQIDRFMEEVGAGLSQAKRLAELMDAISRDVNEGRPCPLEIRFNDEGGVVWVDDGDRNVEVRVMGEKDAGDPLMTMSMQLADGRDVVPMEEHSRP